MSRFAVEGVPSQEMDHGETRVRPATICQLVHTLDVGGAELLAMRLGRHFAGACGYRVLFACLDDLGQLGPKLRDEGFAVHVLRRRPGLDWRCIWRLARLLRRERVDLVHAHQYAPFFYSLVARQLCRRPAILFTEHGRAFPDYPRPKRKLANRLLLSRRDRVVGVGEAVRQALIVNEGLPAERVSVVYNGIDLSAFSPSPEQRAAARQELGLGPDDLVLILVARLDALKDHATALRTLERVVRARPDSRLVLVGEGPERGMLEALVAQLNLGANVHLLGMRSDVARLLAAADVFLLTSVSEGIPLSVIEAMAMGLPVVATRVGGVAEVVAEGQTGLLGPSGDPAALAAHVLRLAADPQLRRHLGQQGRARAQELFAASRMDARYAQLCQEMLRA